MDFHQIEKIITGNGWVLVRTLGSSRQYQKTGGTKIVVLADHGCKDLPLCVVENLESITGLSLRR